MNFIRKHLDRIVRFALIGGLGAVINLGIQYVFTDVFGLWYIFSAIIGFFFSLVNNYFLNYYLKTFKDDRIKNFLIQLDALGFHRVVFERMIHPTNYLYKTQSDVLFDDGSPSGFYPTVVVPEFYKGKTLFIVGDESLQDLLNALKG